MEFESFFRGPNRTVRETWQTDVLKFLDGDEWAIEWQGEEVRDRMTERLDALVWLDHPRIMTMTRVIVRTLKRRVGRGSKIAGGNVEGPLRTFFTDPGHIVKLTWRYHPIMRARVHKVIRENRFRTSPSSACVAGVRSIAGSTGPSPGIFASGNSGTVTTSPSMLRRPSPG
ncbi:adenylate kinase [Amycolatopsis regifaucium]|uniref:adenylate kinase n=1 Tax=Amycolatopsis regifaucium TaxID=546365 RepID=UPI001FC8F55B|nr:adenylate kinase [Amycolatopsis regifaucium]